MGESTPEMRRSTGAAGSEETVVVRPGESHVVATPSAQTDGRALAHDHNTDTTIRPVRRTDDGSSETAAIREDIELTRARMGATLDTLQDRLSPELIKQQAKEVVREAADQGKGLLREAGDQAKEVIREARHQATGAVSDVKERAKDAVRDATIGRAERMMHDASDRAQGAGSSVVETIAANPLPAALVGIGLGWLYFNRRRDSGSGYERNTQPSYNYPGTYFRREYNPEGEYYGRNQGREYRGQYGGQDWEHRGHGPGPMPQRVVEQAREAVGGVAEDARDTVGHVQESVGQFANRAQTTVGQVTSQAQDTVEHAASQAQDTVEHAASRAQEVVGQVAQQAQMFAGEASAEVQHRASDAAWQARYQARRAQFSFERTLNENPLAVGAVAIGLGAALGFLLPQTRQEDELMGPTRDRLMRQAQEQAQQAFTDTKQKVEQVVQDTTEAANEAVQAVTASAGGQKSSGQPSMGSSPGNQTSSGQRTPGSSTGQLPASKPSIGSSMSDKGSTGAGTSATSGSAPTANPATGVTNPSTTGASRSSQL